MNMIKSVFVFLFLALCLGCPDSIEEKSSSRLLIQAKSNTDTEVHYRTEYEIARINTYEYILTPLLYYIHMVQESHNVYRDEESTIFCDKTKSVCLEDRIQAVKQRDSLIIDNFVSNIYKYSDHYGLDPQDIAIIRDALSMHQIKFNNKLLDILNIIEKSNWNLGELALESMYNERNNDYRNYSLWISNRRAHRIAFYYPTLTLPNKCVKVGEPVVGILEVATNPVLIPENNKFIVNGDTVPMNVDGLTAYSFKFPKPGENKIDIVLQTINPLTGKVSETTRNVTVTTN